MPLLRSRGAVRRGRLQAAKSIFAVGLLLAILFAGLLVGRYALGWW